MGRAWGNTLTKGYLTQKRDRHGRFSKSTMAKLTGRDLHLKAARRNGGFVPYHRHGVGHNTFGVNSGVRVSPNRRVSAGFYVRTETDSGGVKAKKIAEKQEFVQLALAGRLPMVDSHGQRTLGGNLKRVKYAQSKLLRRTIGSERRFGKTGYARSGTDRNGIPTLIVRYNSPKDKGFRKGAYNKRNKAIVNYNVNAVTGKRTHDWTQKPKKTRPQRRKKNR